MALTDTAARQAKPKEKDYKLSGGKGLFLLVKVNGAKYWRLKYRYGGKEKLLALGVYPEVSLAEARRQTDKAREQLRDHIDPGEEKKKAKRVAKISAENAFEVIAREWWEQQKGRWKPKHADNVLNTLKADIFPRLGHRPISEIQPPEVLEAVKRVERRGALDVANRLLQRCTAVFRYAIQTGRATYNPAAELRGVLKTRKVQHQASLPRSELPAFLRKLRGYEGHILTRLALKLQVLTFVRPGELRGARWAEFDLERKEWRIPADRMKMGSEHIVPLSRQAIEVIKELQPISGKNELLFPGERSPLKPISENTMTYALYRMGYKSRATPHGFRATASSILNEHGFHHDAVERQLAHIERNKVRGAYTHHAEYLKERRKMMQWWADFLDQQKSGSNVIPANFSK